MMKHMQLRDQGGRFDGVIRLEPEVNLAAAPRVPARLAHAIALHDEAVEYHRRVLAGTVLSSIQNVKGTTHVRRIGDDFFLLDEGGNTLAKRDASAFNFLWASDFRGVGEPGGGEVIDVRNPVAGHLVESKRSVTDARFAELRETRRALADIRPPSDDALFRIFLDDDGWTAEPVSDAGIEPRAGIAEERESYFQHIETILNARERGAHPLWWRATGADRATRRPAPPGEGEHEAILVRPSELVPDEDLSREALAAREAERERRRGY